MGDPVIINLRHVARGLDIPLPKVQAVVELLDEGNTVPFITRYRKDQTGGLDEEQIRQIQSRLGKMRMLAERKQTILRSIESQGKLSEKLARQIHSASTTKRLEDLYLPFKPKKQTLATLARNRGLGPLAHAIIAADPTAADLDGRAADFIDPDCQVPTAADALLGAGHILAEEFSEMVDLRQRLRELLQRTGKLVSARIGGEAKPPEERQPQPEAKRPSAEDPQPVENAQQAVMPQPVDSPAETVADPPAEAAVADLPVEAVVDEPPAVAAVAVESPVEPIEAVSPEVANGEQAVGAALSGGPDGDSDTPSEPAADEQSAAPTSDQAGAQGENSQGDSPIFAETKIGTVPTTPAPSPPPPAPKAAKSERRPSKKDLKKKKAEETLQKAFSDYFDYSEEIKKIPPHRVLAINRGERAKVLRVRIEYNLEAMHRVIDEVCIPTDHPHIEFLRGCARDALARLILPSLEREVRRELTERAETHAVDVFARNLRNLLLQPPIHNRRVLAVDPGYKSGCKLAALDQFGNVLAHEVIYLVGKPDRRRAHGRGSEQEVPPEARREARQHARQEARDVVCDLIRRFGLTLVAIGNGTACRDAEDFFAELIADRLKDDGVAFAIVNEAGASVYSTSRAGREEFPHYDATLRGAISIGRRLQDPLSELVKIDPANIGVGLYQHDVKAKHLRTSLDDVIESCVNYVGVDVNTASPALLRYVSGLNQLTARRLYERRLEHGPFRSRQQFREVPGFGEATFVQAAGFLKIGGGENPLDATWIHPESYPLADRVMNTLGTSPDCLAKKEALGSLAEKIAALDASQLATEFEVGTLLLGDILSQLARPGRDPREDLPGPVFKQGVLKLEDLAPGMELKGTVLNVVDFGAFVDIGMHDSGLVHVSQLADKFIRDPHDLVAVGDIVKVWVLAVDKARRRVSLTMIPPGTERQRPAGRGKGRGEERGERGGQGERGESAPRRPAPEGSQEPRPERSQESRPVRRGQSERPPRREARSRDQGGRPSRQSHDRRPTRTDYRPKSPPKPVTPITDEMKAGKEPMRSFGDLMQFFEPSKSPEAKADPRAGSKPPKKPSRPPTPPGPPKPPAAEPEQEPIASPADAASDDQAASQPLPEPTAQVEEQQEEILREPPPKAAESR